MSDDEFLCVKCARVSLTCCQQCEIYATPADARRISEHTGLPIEAFTEFRVPDDPVYLNSHGDDPIWPLTVLREDNARRVLQRKENGDCRFLGERGCTLPLETRPLVCRLYPYDYNEAGIKPRLAQGCPVELLRPGRTLLQELDMNLQDAERWHRQLYQEIREEPHARIPSTSHVDGSLPPGDARCTSA